ncbi:MAG TPA: hypothetical protein PLI59_22400 [Candidatus Obscuribacter sp.]|nr:hypothetical protein [Candidatus Obscuribacter sp.]MBK9280115.1 hypothetical protein [Candidatus Obscuribacter sp.]MBL8083136.1 hypothetical protein [Candidatus Obscuribacter sp.]HMY03782.1 hypothetical protein [Candidatus Obscuribacter sp.]HMY55799.1 hypothetical protein [Candidatus Obscuribacter sp.]
MHLSEQKKLAFLWQTVMGIIILVLAYLLSRDDGSGDPTRLLASWILIIPGLVCLLFGLTTFVLRQEPDIWT